MKFTTFLEDKQAEIEAAKKRYEVKASESELQSRGKEFEKEYGDDTRRVWSDYRDSMFHLVGRLKSINMTAAVWKDMIKDEDSLQEFFFDKVFPFVKAHNFPAPFTPGNAKVIEDLKKWMMAK